MNEADRIRALRDEGKIDDAQAQRLLAAIDAITEAEAQADGHATEHDAGDVVPAQADAASDAAPDVAPDVTPDAATPSSASSSASATERVSSVPLATASAVERWLDVQLFACAIDVDVDPTASTVVATTTRGDVRVDDVKDGWRLQHEGDADGNWLDRLIGGMNDKKIKVTVPANTGVRLDVRAGDVELDGVPALAGRLTAGDLDATGLKAVDLSVQAGDVDLDLDPCPGHHVVRLSVGDLTVNLPEQADARIDGNVSIGDASAFPPISSERNGMVAASLRGVLGEGRSTLELRVGTGDLEVQRSHHGN